MGLIKKIDVDKHFAARRATRLGRTGPLSHAGAAGIKPTAGVKKALVSADAATLGHCSPGVSSASIPIAPDFGRGRLLRPPGSRRP
jgi:hypothetical protein